MAKSPPEEAKLLADRLEIHHTPKHGSWLNQAEIELSVLARQCLSRRIAHQDTLTRQIEGWEERRNAARRFRAVKEISSTSRS